jgi:predicted amidophosphoribosyltransferase
MAPLPEGPAPAGIGNCRVCAYLVHGTAAICYACARETIEPLAAVDERCGVCDLPLREDGTCGNPICSWDDRQFEWNYAIAMRSGILEQAISRFKYENKAGWRDIFARVLVGFLDDHRSTFEDFDVIVASPTYLPENSARAYDHTRAVIDAAEQEGGDRWPFDVGDPPLIIKTAETPRMMGLTWAERNRVARGPLRDALHVPEPGLARRNSILVYDDVFTDGQTLNEVARALRACGATEVCGVTLTRQPFRR